MIPFPWLEAQAPFFYALAIVMTLVESVVVIVVGLVLCLTAVLPEDCSHIDKSDRIFYVRLGLALFLIAAPVVYATGLILNTGLLVLCAIGLGAAIGRAILLALGK